MVQPTPVVTDAAFPELPTPSLAAQPPHTTSQNIGQGHEGDDVTPELDNFQTMELKMLDMEAKMNNMEERFNATLTTLMQKLEDRFTERLNVLVQLIIDKKTPADATPCDDVSVDRDAGPCESLVAKGIVTSVSQFLEWTRIDSTNLGQSQLGDANDQPTPTPPHLERTMPQGVIDQPQSSGGDGVG